MLYLRTMGALSLHEDGPDGPILIEGSKYLVLLAWLSVAPGKRASRDYLSSLLWPTAERKARFRSLRQCLYSLGKAGAGPVFDSEDDYVALDSRELRTDIDDFRAALDARDYEAAIRLARGHFLDGIRNGLGHEMHHWIDAENERIRIGQTLAYTEAVGRYLRRRDPNRAVEIGREYARLEPLSEHAQVLLVQALRASGNDPAALAAYEAYRSLLRDAVGDRPGPELEASIARVREELLRTPSYEIPDLLTQTSAPEPRSGGPGWIALVAAAVLAAMALGWAARNSFLGPRPESWVSGLSVRLPVVPAGTDSVLWLEVTDGRARLGSTVEAAEHVSPESVLSPDGRYVAEPVEVPSGYDIRLVDLRTGDSRILLATPADEKPLDWSPDGRYVAFGLGLGLGGGVGYWHGIGVYDIVGDSIVFLLESGKLTGRTVARWSPDGTRIAFLAGPDYSVDIVVLDADGRSRHPATQDANVSGWPVWSPDSRRLMFSAEPDGRRQLYTVRADGSGLTRLTDIDDAMNAYAWPSITAALVTRGSQPARRPWALNPTSGEILSLQPPDGQDYATLFRYWPRFDPPPWIHHVSIGHPGSAVALGERVTLELQGWTASGEPIEVDPSSVRWSVSDSSVGRLEGYVLEARATGTIRLIGSAGGWRADTLTLHVADAEEADLEPAFDEDWSAGLDTTVWIPVGEPFPSASPAGGPDSAGVFVSNGDKSYMSGAFSRRAFPLAEGVTMEVWGRMPFDGDHFQLYTARLLDATIARSLYSPKDSWRVDVMDSDIASLNFAGYGNTSQLKGADHLIDIPWPEPTYEWHRYTLQIEPDGTASVRYDDRLVARVPDFVRVEPTDSVFVAIGGNMWNERRVEHGRLRVYEGLRYRLR